MSAFIDANSTDTIVSELPHLLSLSTLQSVLDTLPVVLGCILLVVTGSYASIEKPVNALEPNRFHPLFDQSDCDKALEPSLDVPLGGAIPVVAGVVLLVLYQIGKVPLEHVIPYWALFASWKKDAAVLQFLGSAVMRRTSLWTGISSDRLNPRYRLTLSRESRILPRGDEQALFLPQSTPRQRILRDEAIRNSRDPIQPQDQLDNFSFTQWDIASLVLSAYVIALCFLLGYLRHWVLRDVVSLPLVVYMVAVSHYSSFGFAFSMLVVFLTLDLRTMVGIQALGAGMVSEIAAPFIVQLPLGLDSGTNKLRILSVGPGALSCPGTLLALCLRYDLYNFYQSHANTEFHHLQRYSKPYFFTALGAYSAGMLLVVERVYFTGTVVPALFVVAPLMVVGLLVVAAMRKEWRKLWRYDEEKERKEREDNVVVSIVCSKETLILAGRELSEDEDDDEWVPSSQDSDDDYM